MSKLSPTQTIAFLLILVGGMLGIVYWGNLAWRNPTRFREMSFFNSDGKWFVVYLWFYRIFVLVFGIAILLSILMAVLNLVGMMK